MQRLPSRLEAVRAGWEFLGFVSYSRESLSAPKEKQELIGSVLEPILENLRKVFINPTFPLEQVVGIYAAELGSNAVLEKAFYGLPEYVFRWFRVGQVVMGACEYRKMDEWDSLDMALVAVTGSLSAAGLSQTKIDEVIACLRKIHKHKAENGRNFKLVNLLQEVDSLIQYYATEEDKLIMKTNPWVAGSFWLFALLSVVTCFRVIVGSALNPIWIPVVVGGGIICTLLIGVLTLRSNEQIKDKTFIELVGLILESLPIIGRLIPTSKSQIK